MSAYILAVGRGRGRHPRDKNAPGIREYGVEGVLLF